MLVRSKWGHAESVNDCVWVLSSVVGGLPLVLMWDVCMYICMYVCTFRCRCAYFIQYSMWQRESVRRAVNLVSPARSLSLIYLLTEYIRVLYTHVYNTYTHTYMCIVVYVCLCVQNDVVDNVRVSRYLLYTDSNSCFKCIPVCLSVNGLGIETCKCVIVVSVCGPNIMTHISLSLDLYNSLVFCWFLLSVLATPAISLRRSLLCCLCHLVTWNSLYCCWGRWTMFPCLRIGQRILLADLWLELDKLFGHLIVVSLRQNAQNCPTRFVHLDALWQSQPTWTRSLNTQTNNQYTHNHTNITITHLFVNVL